MQKHTYLLVAKHVSFYKISKWHKINEDLLPSLLSSHDWKDGDQI